MRLPGTASRCWPAITTTENSSPAAAARISPVCSWLQPCCSSFENQAEEGGVCGCPATRQRLIERSPRIHPPNAKLQGNLLVNPPLFECVGNSSCPCPPTANALARDRILGGVASLQQGYCPPTLHQGMVVGRWVSSSVLASRDLTAGLAVGKWPYRSHRGYLCAVVAYSRVLLTNPSSSLSVCLFGRAGLLDCWLPCNYAVSRDADMLYCVPPPPPLTVCPGFRSMM